jgi:bifunctional enzyme Fae/Hps
MLNPKIRYLQIAFNYDKSLVSTILPTIPYSERIIIEAGTPYIKREGIAGLLWMRRHWHGPIVADLKTLDGAYAEVLMARNAGATCVTTLGSAPVETLDIFIETCRKLKIDSMIDMLGVDDPLEVILNLKQPPDVAILHRGRDEENTRGKVIQYRHVKRLRSKYNVIIAAAGGVDLKEARSAIFNGASIVVVNLVKPSDPWEGISTESNVRDITQTFLATIE